MGISAQAESQRPVVVLVNQYCYPDVASTGHLIHILAHELAENHGFEVEVLTTQPSYGDKDSWVDCPRVERDGHVTFKRVWAPRLSKNVLAGRAIKDGVYMIQLGLRSVFGMQKGKVFVYTTAPPYGALVGVIARILRRQTFCTLLYDSYPQVGVWVGTFKKGGFIERAWHWMNRRIYNGAKRKIVLCSAASKLLQDEYAVPDSDIAVIPNWADGEKIYPVAKAETDFAKELDCVEPFTLLYSGNMGLYYDFDTILGAAELLKDEAFRLVLVGGGGKKAWCEEQVKARGLSNTVVLPYRPFETLNDSLNACDASLVTIAEGIEGISFPSKLYTSLATGKAIVAISEEDSELRSIVEDADCGIWAGLGDSESLASGIRALMADAAKTEEMGVQARALFERRYTRQICSAQYAEVIRAAGEDAGVYPKTD
ncbi:MAG: glycosyltransferase family 4 protein [Phycisphaerales bacterium]|nr:glycosyltransferase family 4 protein [Phycisphaerales bacterium]